jgi:hypothetical protein
MKKRLLDTIVVCIYDYFSFKMGFLSLLFEKHRKYNMVEVECWSPVQLGERCALYDDMAKPETFAELPKNERSGN